MMAAGENRFSTATWRQMPVLAQSQVTLDTITVTTQSTANNFPALSDPDGFFNAQGMGGNGACSSPGCAFHQSPIPTLDAVTSTGYRLPDFVSGNINVAIPNPFTLTFVGWSISGSLDRYGHLYWSLLGVGVGKSATVVSASAQANWMIGTGTPTAAQLNDFLTGNGFNVGAGFVLGGSYSTTPNSGSAWGVGFFTPQAGGSYNYSYTGGSLGSGW